MKRKKILYFREPDVATILHRRLAPQGYAVWPKIGLEDVLLREPSDRLSDREIQYLKYATFDFVVAHKEEAVFVVEFDGIDHLNDPKVIARDTIKNRFCKMAAVPLLRIMSSEIQEDDKITVLDYMLMRYVAWKNEYPEIIREIEEYAATVGPHYDSGDPPLGFDPSFRFNLMHPFPAREIVLERLWRDHRIAWSMVKPDRHGAAQYLCDVAYGGCGPAKNEQFHKCSRRALVWRNDAEHAPVFSHEVAVSLRSWLPTRVEVPSPDAIRDFLSDTDGRNRVQGVEEIVDRFNIRVESMWFPELPGISALDIAETYSEYLGFRAIESWAKKNRSNRGPEAPDPGAGVMTR